MMIGDSQSATCGELRRTIGNRSRHKAAGREKRAIDNRKLAIDNVISLSLLRAAIALIPGQRWHRCLRSCLPVWPEVFAW